MYGPKLGFQPFRTSVFLRWEEDENRTTTQPEMEPNMDLETKFISRLVSPDSHLPGPVWEWYHTKKLF